MTKILRASKAGFPCQRNLWFSVNGVRGENPDTKTQRIFDVGTCLEPLVVEWLRADGWTVDYNPGSQQAAVEYSIKVDGGEIHGHPDCFISRPDGLQNVLVDIKTMNERAFMYWKKEGSLKSKPQYVDQLHIYALGAMAQGRKVEHLAIAGVNKNNSEMFIDVFDYDPARAALILIRAEGVFVLNQAPETNCPSEKWCCGYCEYAKQCELYSRNVKAVKAPEAQGNVLTTNNADIVNALELLKEARELTATGEELEKEAKAVLDERVKNQGYEGVQAGGMLLNIATKTSNRFSSSEFKKVHPDLYKEFCKPSTSVCYTFAGKE